MKLENDKNKACNRKLKIIYENLIETKQNTISKEYALQ